MAASRPGDMPGNDHTDRATPLSGTQLREGRLAAFEVPACRSHRCRRPARVRIVVDKINSSKAAPGNAAISTRHRPPRSRSWPEWACRCADSPVASAARPGTVRQRNARSSKVAPAGPTSVADRWALPEVGTLLNDGRVEPQLVGRFPDSTGRDTLRVTAGPPPNSLTGSPRGSAMREQRGLREPPGQPTDAHIFQVGRGDATSAWTRASDRDRKDSM